MFLLPFTSYQPVLKFLPYWGMNVLDLVGNGMGFEGVLREEPDFFPLKYGL